MNRRKWKIAVPVLLSGMALLFSGCGGQSYSNGTPTGTGTTTTTATTPTIVTTVTTPTVVSTPTSSVIANFTPSLSFSFMGTSAVTGNGSVVTGAITSDNLFVVRVNAQSAYTSLGSNFPANYNCVQYTITAFGSSQTTSVLAIPGGQYNNDCPNAPTTQIFDFSSYAAEPGHGAETITISDVQTDTRYMDCVTNQWNPSYGIFGCQYYYPLSALYDARPDTKAAWRAQVSLDVQINSAD